MKTLLALTLILTGAAFAAPVITLTPSNHLVAEPGRTTGWGALIQPDPTDWISFTGSQVLFESNAGFGFYQDLIGGIGGPASGALAPGLTTWELAFDETLVTGVGSYTISPLASIGDFSEGTLIVFFERFSDNPLTCQGCLIGSDFATFDFSVRADVPEPASLLLVGAGAVLIGVGRGRRGLLRRG
jgi:hypothetical protein